ncbi:MAG: hypothetical protein KC656_08045 [Myxococcales bacterium]|nr:hypothetical protein [Myxococcales bacterium]
MRPRLTFVLPFFASTLVGCSPCRDCGSGTYCSIFENDAGAPIPLGRPDVSCEPLPDPDITTCDELQQLDVYGACRVDRNGLLIVRIGV